MLETFVDRLADTFVQGELFIDNWSLAKGVKINVHLFSCQFPYARVSFRMLEPTRLVTADSQS